jgi:hypothetical protein
MRKSAAPLVVLAILCLAYSAFLSWSAGQLPDPVAMHFGFGGQPDRWTTRSFAVGLMRGFGLGLPLLMVVVAVAIRFLPAGSINMPNREYWLAPERRGATYDLIAGQLLWLACLQVAFLAGLQWLTITANNSNPVRLPTQLFLTLLGAFLACVAVWIVTFVRRFRRPAN